MLFAGFTLGFRRRLLDHIDHDCGVHVSHLFSSPAQRTQKNAKKYRWTKKLWFADDKEGRPEKRMGKVFPEADCRSLQSHGFGCSFEPITIEVAHQRSSRLVMDWPQA